MKFSRSIHLVSLLWVYSIGALAQPSANEGQSVVPHTAVKNQAKTGTCWSFSTLSLLESETIRHGLGELDLSEMFIVRNVYKEKAKNYILRQGKAQFGPGGLGHDVIFAIHRYGAMPESVYSGLLLGDKQHDHGELDDKLLRYLDGVLETRPIRADWITGFEQILDDHLGKVPESFVWKEKTYTPRSFADEVLRFKKDDYVMISSFSHHDFYKPFILEVPDNYGSASYHNVPLGEMVELVRHAVANGYSVMWDADVSNDYFSQREGYAVLTTDGKLTPDAAELPVDQSVRQRLFDELTTQDDHLMHLVGMEKSPSGKTLFLVKNSWGAMGPFEGYIKVSENYLALNTISLVVPKAAVPASLLDKLDLR